MEQEGEKKKRSGRADIDRQAALLAETMLELKAAQDQAAGVQAEGQAGGRADGTTGAGVPKQGGGPKAAGGQKKEAAPKTGGKRAFGGYGQSEYAYGKHLRSAGSRFKSARSNNPDVLYGRDFDDSDIIDLVQLVGEMGEVVIHGQITGWDEREIRGGRTIVTLTVTDYTDTIHVKVFAKDEADLKALQEKVSKGMFVKIRGLSTQDRFDNELNIGTVVGIKKSSDFRTPRMDRSEIKRVELHCHTKMSDMDGVSDVKDIIKRAKSWGHTAIAVTDHGVVQAYPDASHSLDKGDSFKVIYGMEGYLVDDLKDIVEDARGQSLDAAYVVFDIETTGFSAENDRIIEIGAVRVEKVAVGNALALA